MRTHTDPLRFLERMTLRLTAGGFAIWTHDTHIKDNETRLNNLDRKVMTKAAELLKAMELQDHELERLLEIEASAHAATRRAALVMAAELHRKSEALKVAERKVSDLLAFVDSGKFTP